MLHRPLITTVGSAVLDLTFYTMSADLVSTPKQLTARKLLAFEYGAKIVSQDVHFSCGGGALNTATTFSRLGLSTQIITSIGNDALGQELLSSMRQEHINSRMVQIHPGQRTGFSFIVHSTNHHDHVIFFFPGARSELSLSPAVVKKINTSWIYLSSVSGSQKWYGGLQAVMARAAGIDSKIVWNPGAEEIKAGWPKLKRLFPLTEALVVNLDEAIELLLSRGEKIKQVNPRQIVKSLHQFGQQMTVVTCGDKGVYVLSGNKLLFKSAVRPNKVINTTGAGDAFGSGFLAGLIKYRGNISRAMALGTYNSSNVVSHIGAEAGILTAQKLAKLNI